jgi:hypothetical protein
MSFQLGIITMADFHPKPHQNTLGQLHQSLEQLKESLTVCPPVDQSSLRSAPQPSHQVVEPWYDHRDWESAFASAAADIDNYFNRANQP